MSDAAAGLASLVESGWTDMGLFDKWLETEVVSAGASAPEMRPSSVCPRRRRKEGTASMSKDSEISYCVSASTYITAA